MSNLNRGTVEDLDSIRGVLKPAQERVLAEVAGWTDEQFTRADYEAVAHVSRSQAAYDLSDLVNLGLVERLGSGRATRYRLAQAGTGRRRKWTRERIRVELEAFCEEAGGWPRAAEFKGAGRADLYLAASRYGGIDHWAEELGFVEPDQLDELEKEPPARGREARRRGTLLGAGIPALAALTGLGLLLLGGDGPPTEEQVRVGPLVRQSSDIPGRRGAETAPLQREQGEQEVALRLVAAEGDSWLRARRGSADGRLLWEGILERGESLRLQGRLWLRLGAPSSLVARLNGDRAALPRRTSTARVTQAGIRVLTVAKPALVSAAGSGGAEEELAQATSEPVAQAASSTTKPVSQQSSSPSSGAGPSPDDPPGSGSGPQPDPPPGG